MSDAASLGNAGACVFDAYGTLFDFAAAADRCRDALGEKADELNILWRAKQLQYTWLRSLMGEYVEFWQITGDALDYAMEGLGIEDAALRRKLMDLYLKLDTFPEIKDMLVRLKDGGMKTAVLSNGSSQMLKSAVEGAQLGELLNAVISVDSLRIYKPHPSVYQLAVDALDVPADRICFMSSNAWDANGAAAFGFQVVWCNRYAQKPERLPGESVHMITTLAELPALLDL